MKSFLADLGLIFGLAGAQTAVAAQRFEFRNVGSEKLFTPSAAAEISQVAAGWNRSHVIGNSLFTLSGLGLALVVATLLFGPVIVSLIPRVLGVQTPGEFFVFKTSRQHRSDDDTKLAGESEQLVVELEATAPLHINLDDELGLTSSKTETTEFANEDDTLQLKLRMRNDSTSSTEQNRNLVAAPNPTRFKRAERANPSHSTTLVRERQIQTSKRFDDLAIASSSLSDSPLTEIDLDASSGDLAAHRAPEWSEEWQAWLYWNREDGVWYRYEDESSNWLAIAPA